MGIKKIVLLIVIIFLSVTIISCNKKNDLDNFLGVAKIDIINANSSEIPINIWVFTGTNIDNLKYIDDEDAKIISSFKKDIMLKKGNNKVSGYLYQFTLQPNKSTSIMNTITLKNNYKQYKINFGRYQKVKALTSDDEVNINIQSINLDNNKYQLMLYINNLTYQKQILTKVISKYKEISHQIAYNNISSNMALINKNELKVYQHLSVSINSYYYLIQSILSINLKNNISESEHLVSYYINLFPTDEVLLTEGIDINKLSIQYD